MEIVPKLLPLHLAVSFCNARYSRKCAHRLSAEQIMPVQTPSFERRGASIGGLLSSYSQMTLSSEHCGGMTLDESRFSLGPCGVLEIGSFSVA